MDLNIGSNIYRNTSGILKIQGREQIVLEIRGEEKPLFLTMDFYDAQGAHLAHLRRNVWAFNYTNRFEIQTSQGPQSLFTYPALVRIIDKETGDTAVEVRLVEKESIHIPHGKFYSHKGQLLEITPHCLRVPGFPSLFGNVLDVRGGPVAIAQG